MGSKSDQFIHELVQFYRNRGVHNVNPQQFVARLNGRTVDLWQLYSFVTELGGSYKVNQSNQWDEVYCRLFKTSITGANISVALRQIYSRFLLPYEKAFSSNFGNDMLDDEDEENPANSSANFSTVQLYHHHQHQYQHQYQHTTYQNNFVSVTANNNNTDQVNPFNKLFCSLLSGLPNELDFALKVSTILTNTHSFDWSSDSKFVDLLLECCPYYCCVCSEEELSSCDVEHIDEVVSDTSDACNDESESSLNNPKLPSDLCKCYERFWLQQCNNEQVVELVFGSQNYQFKELNQEHFEMIYRRIKFMAELIRNLSFSFEDYQDMATSGGSLAMLKFLILLLMCDDPAFNNMCLDILSNIITSTAFNHEDHQYDELRDHIYKRCTRTAMTSNNVYSICRCLEIISRILYFASEDILLGLVDDLKEQNVYQRVIQLLTCQNDINLLVATLEFCLSLSEQQPHLLINEEDKHLIKIILCLLNCEASQHFSSKALAKIKIIDERPRQMTSTSTNTPQSSQTQSQNQPVNALTQTNAIDNETFATSWLKATYEPVAQSPVANSLKVSELYADYVKMCCRSARKNVIAAQSFTLLVKRCFPSANITNNCSVIEGIALKSNSTTQKSQQQTQSQQQQQTQQTLTQPQPLLASPILKAHLSAPPKNSGTNTCATNTTTANGSTSISNLITSTSTSTSTTACNISANSLSQSIPTTNTSTLIKSLLANKLRSNAVITTSSLPNSTATTTNTSTLQNNATPTTPTLTSAPANTLIQTSETNVLTNSLVNSVPTSQVAVSMAMGQPIAGSVLTTNAAQGAPQQFLLVRTIITNSNQQQAGGPGLATAGSPVRLILPANLLTQQRPNNIINVNGISTSPNTSITNVPIVASSTESTTTTNTTNTDLFLKTVLSTAGTNPNSIASPVRNSVKSSPLLNVLLDKGKLPEFTTNSTQISNSIVNTNSVSTIATTVLQPQQPKMYILTTKSPIAIKSLPTLNANTQQLQSVVQQPQVSVVTTPTTMTPISSASNFVPNQSTSPKTQQIPSFNLQENQMQLNPKLNGEINETNIIQPVKVVTTSVITSINSVNTCVKNTDLSSIKDIKKTVDDATKLMLKRPKQEEGPNAVINKKLKQQNSDNVPNNQMNGVDFPQQGTASVSTSCDLVNKKLEFECLWHECNRAFMRPTEVFLHVYNTHVMPSTFPNIMTCQWGGPEGVGPGCMSKRPKLSLLTHILDYHCNPNVLQQYACRKQQLSNSGVSTINFQQPPAHPGYAQNAAILAIRRHATNYVELPTPQPVTKTTPLTVSIRLTAALILRNLAENSTFVKRMLESHEQYLSELCMTDRDESRTIAQCLAVIIDKQISS